MVAPSGPFQSKTEEAVFKLCQRSFLSLWSYPNPRRRPTDQRELCDILVVCDPHVIIFSVKEVLPKLKPPPEVMFRRWVKKAVERSVDQLYGAQRILAGATEVVQHDGTLGLLLPEPNRRVVHLVSVSLGAHGVFPLPSGVFGRGFVHIFDEQFLDIAMRELDTITDFVQYLGAKEDLFSQYPRLAFEGGEKNLLAIFLKNGREFPDEPPPLMIEDGIWQELRGSDRYRRKQEIDRQSYDWDGIIERLSREVSRNRMVGQATFGEQELILRYLAQVSRLGRRELIKALTEFRQLAAARKVRSRLVPSPFGVAFLFHNARSDDSREERIRELSLRCYVARDLLEDDESLSRCETVIGIGTNIERTPKGFCTDLALVSQSVWTGDDRKTATQIREDLGYFQDPESSSQRVEEYPAVGPDS